MTPDGLLNVLLGLSPMEASTLTQLRVRDNVGPVVETCDFPATIVVIDDAVKLLAVEHFLALENIGVFFVDSRTGSVVMPLWFCLESDRHPLGSFSWVRA